MSDRQLEARIPPAVLVLAIIAVQWGLANALQALTVAIPARIILVLLLGASGVACIASGVFAFRKADTSVDPLHPEKATTFVISGIYRWSRNPMYLGFALIVASAGVALANVASFAMVIFFVMYMNAFQIAPEERILSRKFGDSFEAYRKQVRRWL